MGLILIPHFFLSLNFRKWFQSFILHIFSSKMHPPASPYRNPHSGGFVEDIIKRLAYCINPDLAVIGQEPEDGVHSYHSLAGNYPIFFPMFKEGEDGDVQGRISTSTGRQLC